MGLRDVAAVAKEFSGWFVKRWTAKVMNWDAEIDRLRRKVGQDPTDRDSFMRLRLLERRAGHDPHKIAVKRMSTTIKKDVVAIELSSFEANCYVPSSLEVETIGQMAVPNRDYRFNSRSGSVVWLIEPAIDQELTLRWHQWEPDDGEEEESEAIPHPYFQEDPSWE